MSKFVRDLMRRGVITCHTDTPLPEVARRMAENKVTAVVVVDEGGEVCGIVTRKDLVGVYNQDYKKMVAENVMSSDVATIIPDIPVTAAALIMLDRDVSRLVIMHEKPATQRPVGILSMSDIVRDMAG
ncbi:MAG TPA: CBS domain-containing protein [Chloroflexi bacterium]|nr:CBS domain-containing protein [Chloroflexota bacterium]